MKSSNITRFFAVFLIFSIIFASSSNVYADNNTHNSEKSKITMEDINSSEVKIIYTSQETVLFGNKSGLRAVYPIYTRVQVVQSSSNGITERGNRIGIFSSISSFALSFISGITAMTVSQILSAVSLVVSNTSYVQSRTFTSFVQYQKSGQARWADQTAYTSWVVSGVRNYYKHILGAKQLSNGQWATHTRDYLESPARIDKGMFYDNTDNWFKTQASQRIQTGQFLFDLPW